MTKFNDIIKQIVNKSSLNEMGGTGVRRAPTPPNIEDDEEFQKQLAASDNKYAQGQVGAGKITRWARGQSENDIMDAEKQKYLAAKQTAGQSVQPTGGAASTVGATASSTPSTTAASGAAGATGAVGTTSPKTPTAAPATAPAAAPTNQTFKQAFAAARANQGQNGAFEWNKKSYNTRLAGEAPAPTPPPRPADLTPNTAPAAGAPPRPTTGSLPSPTTNGSALPTPASTLAAAPTVGTSTPAANAPAPKTYSIPPDASSKDSNGIGSDEDGPNKKKKKVSESALVNAFFKLHDKTTTGNMFVDARKLEELSSDTRSSYFKKASTDAKSIRSQLKFAKTVKPNDPDVQDALDATKKDLKRKLNNRVDGMINATRYEEFERDIELLKSGGLTLQEIESIEAKYVELSEITKKKWEDSDEDKRVDKKLGYKEGSKKDNTADDKMVKTINKAEKKVEEEVEPIEELSRNKIKDYLISISKTHPRDGTNERPYNGIPRERRSKEENDKLDKLSRRDKSVGIASNKLVASMSRKGEVFRNYAKVPATEEVEPIEEVSTKTLKSYVHGALKDADDQSRKAAKEKELGWESSESDRKIDNRSNGITTATNKIKAGKAIMAKYPVKVAATEEVHDTAAGVTAGTKVPDAWGNSAQKRISTVNTRNSSINKKLGVKNVKENEDIFSDAELEHIHNITK